jgi:hypothetical protein
MKADANYDPRSALLAYAPGVVLTREIELALLRQFAVNNSAPLTSAQVLAITGPLPVFPSTIPYIPQEFA